MKVGDLVKEGGWHAPGPAGIVMAIDPLRRTEVESAGFPCVEIVIWLTTGLQTYADPRRWEVISEGR